MVNCFHDSNLEPFHHHPKNISLSIHYFMQIVVNTGLAKPDFNSEPFNGMPLKLLFFKLSELCDGIAVVFYI